MLLGYPELFGVIDLDERRRVVARERLLNCLDTRPRPFFGALRQLGRGLRTIGHRVEEFAAREVGPCSSVTVIDPCRGCAR